MWNRARNRRGNRKSVEKVFSGNGKRELSGGGGERKKEIKKGRKKESMKECNKTSLTSRQRCIHPTEGPKKGQMDRPTD